MKLNELSPLPRSKRKRMRVGRGMGSGRGHTSGRGNKGQKSRSGAKLRAGFEGGQLAFIKRMPSKRGFTNIFKTDYSVVNLGELNAFDAGSVVGPDTLHSRKLVRSSKRPIKILGDGSLSKALIIRASKFSRSAIEKIEAAGGKAEKID